MPTQDDLNFKEGRWPLCDDSPLTKEMFEEYVAKHGEDRALGYLDAVRDFQKHFQRCFEGVSGKDDGISFYHPPVTAQSMVKKLFHRNASLLKFYSSKKSDTNVLKP